MTKRHNPPQQYEHRRGGKIIPAFFNLVGTLLMLGVIALMLPSYVPRFMGYEVYNVVSGSMAPAIPVGSMVLVEPEEAELIEPGEVIAFYNGSAVVTHRVLEIRRISREFVTKGDANENEDLAKVPFTSLIGVVRWHVPYLGEFTAFISTVIGKIYLFALLLCGLLLNVIAGRLREA
ncbi:MAG: signal peptidase I [Oscillospiraceae bacterium]|nr:signal peptidase I [Oscillospiraceae bacterium]